MCKKDLTEINKNMYNGLAWLGLAWLGLAWLGLAWLGLAWLGLAWVVFSATFNNIKEYRHQKLFSAVAKRHSF